MNSRLAVGLLVLGALASSPALASEQPSPELFPFVLPWDDSVRSVVDLSDWLDKPAGRLGHLRAGADGHIYAGAKRVRLFGADLECAGEFSPQGRRGEDRPADGQVWQSTSSAFTLWTCCATPGAFLTDTR